MKKTHFHLKKPLSEEQVYNIEPKKLEIKDWVNNKNKQIE